MFSIFSHLSNIKQRQIATAKTCLYLRNEGEKDFMRYFRTSTKLSEHYRKKKREARKIVEKLLQFASEQWKREKLVKEA